MWVARDRQLVPAAWGTKETLPEYCVSLRAVSVMFAIPLLLFLNRKTWCSAFMSLHRWLGLRVCERSWAQSHDFASLVWAETIEVTWFFDVYLSTIYHPNIFHRLLGDLHPMHRLRSLGDFFLAQRLWSFQRTAPALRYAMPTTITAWSVNEILESEIITTNFGYSRSDTLWRVV